jgi:hypothetical protein
MRMDIAIKLILGDMDSNSPDNYLVDSAYAVISIDNECTFQYTHKKSCADNVDNVLQRLCKALKVKSLGFDRDDVIATASVMVAPLLCEGASDRIASAAKDDLKALLGTEELKSWITNHVDSAIREMLGVCRKLQIAAANLAAKPATVMGEPSVTAMQQEVAASPCLC